MYVKPPSTAKASVINVAIVYIVISFYYCSCLFTRVECVSCFDFFELCVDYQCNNKEYQGALRCTYGGVVVAVADKPHKLGYAGSIPAPATNVMLP